ncbi:MAG TPA: hypothetical protein VLV83_14610 [Acidobacteriota bacterium]|nr:hypothetical protein [Acidobacteriota bacterium]
MQPCTVALEVYFIGLVAFAPVRDGAGLPKGFVAVLPDVLTNEYHYSEDNIRIPPHYPFFAYISQKQLSSDQQYDLEALALLLGIEPNGSKEYMGALILDDEEIEINHKDTPTSEIPQDQASGLPAGTDDEYPFEWTVRMLDLHGDARMDPSVKTGGDEKGIIRGRFKSNHADLKTAGLVTKYSAGSPLRLDAYRLRKYGDGTHQQAMSDITKLALAVEGNMAAANDYCEITITASPFNGVGSTRPITLHAKLDQSHPLQVIFGNIPSSDIQPVDDGKVRHFQVYYELLADRPPFHNRHVPERNISYTKEHDESPPDIVEKLLRRSVTVREQVELFELYRNGSIEREQFEALIMGDRYYPWDIVACPGARFN